MYDDKLGDITDDPITVPAGDTVVLRKTSMITEDTENTVSVSYDQTGQACPDAGATAVVTVEQAPMVCTDHIQAFLFRYIGPSVPAPATVVVKADKFTGSPVTYNLPGGLPTDTVLSKATENGFTIDALAHGQTELGSKTTLTINGVAQVIHTSCSTPFVSGAPAPLDNPKGQPSTLWWVVSFTQK